MKWLHTWFQLKFSHDCYKTAFPNNKSWHEIKSHLLFEKKMHRLHLIEE